MNNVVRFPLAARQVQTLQGLAHGALDPEELAELLGGQAPFAVRAELRALRRADLVRENHAGQWSLTWEGEEIVGAPLGPAGRQAERFVPDVDGWCVNCSHPLSRHTGGRCP